MTRRLGCLLVTMLWLQRRPTLVGFVCLSSSLTYVWVLSVVQRAVYRVMLEMTHFVTEHEWSEPATPNMLEAETTC